MRGLEGLDEVLIDRRAVQGLLILKLGWQVDAVVLADILDGHWWQFLSLGRYAHRLKDMAASLQVAGKGSRRNVGQLRQGSFTDESVRVV